MQKFLALYDMSMSENQINNANSLTQILSIIYYTCFLFKGDDWSFH